MDDDLIICNVNNKYKDIVSELINELTEERRRSRIFNEANFPEYDDNGPDVILVLRDKAYNMDGDLIPDMIGIERVSEDSLSEAKQEFYRRFDAKKKDFCKI